MNISSNMLSGVSLPAFVRPSKSTFLVAFLIFGRAVLFDNELWMHHPRLSK